MDWAGRPDVDLRPASPSLTYRAAARPPRRPASRRGLPATRSFPPRLRGHPGTSTAADTGPRPRSRPREGVATLPAKDRDPLPRRPGSRRGVAWRERPGPFLAGRPAPRTGWRRRPRDEREAAPVPWPPPPFRPPPSPLVWPPERRPAVREASWRWRMPGP